jgi:hypothetical protein
MENRGKLRTAVEYATARTLFWALGLLPRRLAIGAGRALVYLAYLVVPRLRHVSAAT